MDKPLENFVRWLKDRLKMELPGYKAQMQMMPRNVDQSSFVITSQQNPKAGSVLILIYPKQNDIYIALMKRPEYDGVHSGQISFPGGKMEEGDKDLIFTAVRESEEEVGIRGQDVSIIGQLTEHFVVASNFKVLPVVGYLNYQPHFKPDNHEVEEVVEVSLNHLLDRKNRKEKTLIVRHKYELIAPYFDVFGHVVWGATAMILSEFLELTRDYKF